MFCMNSEQMSFATVPFERFAKTTRRSHHLDEMNHILPWTELCALIEPHSQRKRRSRSDPPRRPPKMFQGWPLENVPGIGGRKRGLSGTKLVISDAHEGLKAAITTVMQGASWQRCKVHFYRNILAHVPQARKLEVAAALRIVFGQVSMEAAQRAASECRALFSKTLTKAIAIFDAGLADALAFLRFPIEHHRSIATNNPIEHLNKEIRRRTRSIGIFPSRESGLRLVTMILIEQSEEWMVERRYMSPDSLELVLQN
jgi:hypothetical protein